MVPAPVQGWEPVSNIAQPGRWKDDMMFVQKRNRRALCAASMKSKPDFPY
jgi:hypothetical protein